MLRIFRHFNRSTQIDTLYQCCGYKILSPHMQSNNALYPPVKQKYPPGRWGSIDPNVAWIIHNEAISLNEIPKVKRRLESMAGKLPGTMLWHLTPLEESPGFLSYKKYVTKTHVIEDDPAVYKTINSRTVGQVCRNVRPHIERILAQEHEGQSKHHLFNYDEYFEFQRLQQTTQNTHVKMGHILQTFYANLGFDADYLLRSQVDEDVRLETFWRRCGYEEHVLPGKQSDQDITEGNSHEYKNFITLRSKMRSSYLVRTEQPLPVFEAWDADVCMGDVEEFPYHPESIYQQSACERPVSVSGHWVGDPCEFHHTSLHVLPPEYEMLKDKHSTEVALEELKSYILQAGFTSTAAQAHNQGFNQYWDLTYPITSQIIATDGKHFTFGAYQLNTLHLWKSQDANPRRNILWLSEPMSLFSHFEDGVVHGLNEAVIVRLLSCLLVKPVTPEHDLRPYLPDEASPARQTYSINFKGEEPFEVPKIGRYEYPRNAVYF